MPFNNDKEEIINCQQAVGKRPSKIDIPFVVSIGKVMTIMVYERLQKHF